MQVAKNLDEFIRYNAKEVKDSLRRKGLDPEDGFQDFCVMLLKRGSLSWYNPNLSAFSTFIGTSLRRFIATRLDKKTKSKIVYMDMELNYECFGSMDGEFLHSISDWWQEHKDFKDLCLSSSWVEFRFFNGCLLLLTPFSFITLLLHYYSGDWGLLVRDLGLSPYAAGEWKKRLRNIIGLSHLSAKADAAPYIDIEDDIQL